MPGRLARSLLIVCLVGTPLHAQAAGMDTNDDDKYNIFDVLETVYCALNMGPCDDMDFNQDGNENVLDVMMVLQCIVGGGPCYTMTPGSCVANQDCGLGEACHIPTGKCVTPALVHGVMGAGHLDATDQTSGFSIKGVLSVGQPVGTLQSTEFTLTGLMPH